MLRVLLVEQKLQVFLAAALVGGPRLDGDQPLLFSSCALEFFFLSVQALQFALGLF
ncbi:hypothetical protein D3C80_1888950 [compost metagenome]